MADLGQVLGDGWNADDEEPMRDFEPVPSGKYLAVITESEMKETKDGNGAYLQLEFSIVEPEQYANRKAWARLNLENSSAKAVEIARGEMASICRAVGVRSPQDSEELHDIPLVIKVALVKRKDNGEPSNEIKGYYSADGDEEPKKTTAPKPAANGKGKAPWKK